MNNPCILAAATFAAMLLVAPAVQAQTWDVGGTNNNFTTANNWNPNSVPVSIGTADLIFAGNVRLTPVADTN